MLCSSVHPRADPVPTLANKGGWEVDQCGCSACSFPSPLTSHSTHSKPFLGSVYAFDNIFLQAISLYVNTFSFSVRVKPWQLGEAQVLPTASVVCGQDGDPYQGAAILKMLWPCCLWCPASCLLSCSELSLFLQTESYVTYWGEITEHMNSWFWGTKNYTRWQCDVLYKNQISWFSLACLTSVAWELNSSIFSKETLEQNRESYYSGFVTLHFCSLGLVSSSA